MKLYKEHLFFAAGVIASIAIGTWLGHHLDEGGKATVDGKRPIPILIGNQTIDSQRQKLIPVNPNDSKSNPPDLSKINKGMPETQNNESDPQKSLPLPNEGKTNKTESKQKEGKNNEQEEIARTR